MQAVQVYFGIGLVSWYIIALFAAGAYLEYKTACPLMVSLGRRSPAPVRLKNRLVIGVDAFLIVGALLVNYHFNTVGRPDNFQAPLSFFVLLLSILVTFHHVNRFPEGLSPTKATRIIWTVFMLNIAMYWFWAIVAANF